MGVSNPQRRDFSSKDNIIWTNGGFGNGSAYSSQTGGWFNSQVADDILFDQPVQIIGVHWWGCVIGDIYPNPSPFNIIFYADDGSGTMPTGAGMDDPSSTALALNFLPNVIGIPFGPFDTWFEYNVTLPTSFPAIANTKYWIVIQQINETSQWFWWTNGNNPDHLHDAVQGFPDLGVPYWTNLESGDMAFYLTGHLNIPPSPPIIHGTTNGDVNNEYEFWTDPIIDPSGDSLYIRWDWDDGNITDWLGPYSSGSIASASHSWTQGDAYEIRAQLKGIGGQSNWSEPHSISIFQNTPPIANFTSTIDELIVTLDASSSYDPDGSISTWLWDFGDGTEGAGEILTHTYQTSGTYTVTLTVTDDYGFTDTLAKNLSVEKYQKVFIVGRLKNSTYIGNTIEFTATNLKVITFQPFTYVSYKSGEHIIILNPYTGHLGYRFIFASCFKRV